MPQHIRPRQRKGETTEHLAFGDVVMGAEYLSNAICELFILTR